MKVSILVYMLMVLGFIGCGEEDIPDENPEVKARQLEAERLAEIERLRIISEKDTIAKSFDEGLKEFIESRISSFDTTQTLTEITTPSEFFGSRNLRLHSIYGRSILYFKDIFDSEVLLGYDTTDMSQSISALENNDSIDTYILWPNPQENDVFNISNLHKYPVSINTGVFSNYIHRTVEVEQSEEGKRVKFYRDEVNNDGNVNLGSIYTLNGIPSTIKLYQLGNRFFFTIVERFSEADLLDDPEFSKVRHDIILEYRP